MPTNTYVALDRVTLGSATANVTFSSIPSTYTDLVVIINATASVSAAMLYQLNGDTTASNYSSTGLFGDGSSAGSYRTNNNTISGANSTARNTAILNFQNYSNTTTFKTLVMRGSLSDSDARAVVSLWRNTAAVNQIVIAMSSGTFSVGSTFSLYGIRAEGVSPAVKATGGAIYSDDTYYYHAFYSTGTFTPLQSLNVDALVIAGGGGAQVGGGGAGGLRTASLSVTAQAYTVTVGAGGVGAVFNGTSTKGGNSTFSTITSTGGGQSGKTDTNPRNGFAGGSGGGGAGDGSVSSTGGAGNEGGYSPVEGYAGGGNAGNIASPYPAGGGGGAGGVGSNATASLGGAGGIGVTSAISGTSITYAVGGDGGVGASSIGNGANGTANQGNGGFGSRQTTTGIGGNGGSGVVIVRYAK